MRLFELTRDAGGALLTRFVVAVDARAAELAALAGDSPANHFDQAAADVRRRRPLWANEHQRYMRAEEGKWWALEPHEHQAYNRLTRKEAAQKAALSQGAIQ